MTENGVTLELQLTQTQMDIFLDVVYGGRDRREAMELANELVNEVLIKHKYKYRWHDLRLDPNDLPEHEIVHVKYKYIYSDALFDNVARRQETSAGVYWLMDMTYIGHETDDKDKDKEIVAWKYIEPFNEYSE